MIKVESELLSSALSFNGMVVQGRLTLPILGSVRLSSYADKLTISSSDLEMLLVSDVDLLDSNTDIDICIPYKRFFDLVKNLSGVITIDVKSDVVNISSSEGSYKIHGYKSEDFPVFDLPTITSEMSLDSKLLSSWLPKVLFAVSRDDLRPSMTGVYIKHDGNDKLTMVCTDGHRLSEVVLFVRGSEAFSLVLPHKASSAVSKQSGDMVDVSIHDNSYISFKYDNGRQIISRLIQEKFPNYEAVIPSKDSIKATYTLTPVDLKNSVERLVSFANQNTKQIKAVFGVNKVSLSAEDMDITAEGREDVYIQGSGDVTIGFNGNYMSEALKNFSDIDDAISLNLIDGNKPILLVNDIQRILVMPVMLNSYQ